MRKPKIRNKHIPNKYNLEDVNKWQEKANEQTGGNLTLWIEKSLNEAVNK